MYSCIKKSLFVLVFALFSNTAAALEVGDMAPDFSLPGSDGKTYQLSDYRGKQAVVLAWFPKAYTYGCTIECKSLADVNAKIFCPLFAGKFCPPISDQLSGI